MSIGPRQPRQPLSMPSIVGSGMCEDLYSFLEHRPGIWSFYPHYKLRNFSDQCRLSLENHRKYDMRKKQSSWISAIHPMRLDAAPACSIASLTRSRSDHIVFVLQRSSGFLSCIPVISQPKGIQCVIYSIVPVEDTVYTSGPWYTHT